MEDGEAREGITPPPSLPQNPPCWTTRQISHAMLYYGGKQNTRCDWNVSTAQQTRSLCRAYQPYIVILNRLSS